MMPEVDIVHRSFALVRSEADFIRMFGSRATAKNEIIHHWVHANRNDDLHRFNIDGMLATDFPFPSSMPGLLACKAAYTVAGSAGYWDVFDALQTALFVNNRNLELPEVIATAVKTTGIDFAQWQQQLPLTQTLADVEEDFRFAAYYGLHSVPCLVINGQHRVDGARSLPQIVRAITDAAPADSNSGAMCRLKDGQMHCD